MISVICPTLNEERFIKAWCENVTRFSDDIHVFDCGSKDRTKEILARYPVQVHENLDRYAEGIWRPYLWEEGEIRNSLINKCKHDWIVNLDADELLGDEFFEQLGMLQTSTAKFHRFIQYPFWYSPNLLRVRQPKKDYWRRFYPSTQIRMFRNEPGIRYRKMGNHASLQWRRLGKYSSRLSSRSWDIPFYHYHFILQKENENRANERYENGIRLETFFKNHPRETQYYDWFRSKEI
jgi:glycosyltransferase involved in cell wall biosynthesis